MMMGANPASEQPGLGSQPRQARLPGRAGPLPDRDGTEGRRRAARVCWAEKDGTFTNLERRVQRAPKALRNPQSKGRPRLDDP